MRPHPDIPLGQLPHVQAKLLNAVFLPYCADQTSQKTIREIAGKLMELTLVRCGLLHEEMNSEPQNCPFRSRNLGCGHFLGDPLELAGRTAGEALMMGITAVELLGLMDERTAQGERSHVIDIADDLVAIDEVAANRYIEIAEKPEEVALGECRRSLKDLQTMHGRRAEEIRDRLLSLMSPLIGLPAPARFPLPVV